MNKKISIMLLLFLISIHGSTQDCFDKRLESAIRSYNEKKYDDAITQLRLIKTVCEKFDEKKINEWIGKAAKKKREQTDADGDGFLNAKDICPNAYSKSNGGCPVPGDAFTGFTKMKYEEGTYEGYYVSGQFHGKGTFIFDSGDKYVGNFKNDLYDGDGTMYYQDGSKYIGKWRDGNKEGFGVRTWPDGDKYEGNFSEDLYNGQGTYYFSSGIKYTGAWKDGLREGYGTLVWPDGDIYEGQFKQDKRNGEGTYTYKDGRKYTGKWKDGIKEGYGVMTWPNGDKYEGVFKNDKFTKRNDLGAGFTGFKDHLKELDNCALLEYDSDISGKDIKAYYNKNKNANLYPFSVFKFKNKYYSIWVSLDNAETWYLSWDQPSLHSDSIQKYFNLGYNISFVDKIEGQWYLTMIKYKNDFDQYLPIYPKNSYADSILPQLNKGYAIQNVIDQGDKYRFLLSKFRSDNIYAYNFIADDKDFQPWLADKKKYSAVNYLYCWKDIGGKSFYFLDYMENVVNWEVAPFSEKNLPGIIKRINEGFFINNVTVDGNSIKLTLRKNK